MARMNTPTANFTHHFLIAMPSMTDPHFARTLTYVAEHNEQGALGIIANRPIDMTLAALFERIELPLAAPASRCISAVRYRPTAVSCCTAPAATGIPR